jgi:hypothetical protein
MELALTLFFNFKRQQHRELSWLDKDSDKDQSQFDELFNGTPVELIIKKLSSLLVLEGVKMNF